MGVQQYINRKTQKYSRTMFPTITPKPQSTKYARLEALELGHLFIHIKNLIKEHSSTPIVDPLKSEHRKKIHTILDFIVQKFQAKPKESAEKVVAYISMLVYINVTAKCDPFVVEYGSNFYNNLVHYVKKIIEECSMTQVTDQKLKNRLNLSILLCSLTSLVEQNAKNIINLNIGKIFSLQMLKLLLALQFPNEQKYMKYYRTFILYINKTNLLTGPLKISYLRSLGHHLVNCSVSRNTQMTIIYLMNKCLEDGKLVGRIDEIWSEDQLKRIVPLCLQIVLISVQVIQLKLVLGFCCKMVSRVNLLEEEVVNGELFLKIYTQIYQNVTTSDKLCPCLEQILLKITDESCFSIFKYISAEVNPSTLQLQILEYCTKKLAMSHVFLILQSGYWQKLMTLFQETVSSNYKKYLLNKIISNIIENSRENQQVQAVLNNLYAHSVSICNGHAHY